MFDSLASAQRQADTDLITELEAGTFREGDDFFELVRRIERLAERGTDLPVARIGHDGPPGAEPVRFHGSHNLAFPAQAVEQLRKNDTARLEMVVTFLGLTGPTGVLPSHYSNLVQERLRQRDTGLADFFDLFNHRLLSLFYRAWSKYRIGIQFEEHAQSPGHNPFAQALQSLAGQQPAHPFDPRIYYSGHFARFTRSASNLEQLLGDFLGVAVHIEPFIGQWLPIGAEYRLRIGSGDRGCNNRLGEGVMPGRRCWDMQSKFRVEIGPLDEHDYWQLMPGGERYASLRRLIEEYTPAQLDIELRYLVRGRRRTALGKRLQLGLNFWIHRHPEPLRVARIQLRRDRSRHQQTFSNLPTFTRTP